MSTISRITPSAIFMLGICWVSPLLTLAQTSPEKVFRFPYQRAGLNEKQAAAHLLGRFTYGARPGEIDELVKQGLENWFKRQLEGKQPDDSLAEMLGRFEDLGLSNAQVVARYPQPGQVLRMAIKDGVVDKDSVKIDRREYKEVLKNYMQQHGYKPQQELFRQFMNQKILRASYSHNQLQEVMTSFWFNHFNVSITKNNCARFIPAYERDVVRPNALGRFGDLLLATAKSPAMLFYLDNFNSRASNENKAIGKQKPKRVGGLNENYARELMELHTLGVEGGYTQQDVTEAARILTGWTVSPMERAGKGNLMGRAAEGQIAKNGFTEEDGFLFAAGRHDKGTKTVMGREFGPFGGYEEGVVLLEMLASHSETARFISRKLAVRFVSDNPPQSLIEKMVKNFTENDGDIKEVLITMTTAPEFWDSTAIRQKIKSPLELAIGSVRGLNASVHQPYQLYRQISKMGEKMYYYQAPTGFPDKGQYWINSGSLLNRMNFGLTLANGRIPGVVVDLASLNNNREPESTQAALDTYSRLMMPERELAQTIKRLSPMLNDPALSQKIRNAEGKSQITDSTQMEEADPSSPEVNKTTLSQVVGIIIGSPEYQRR